MAVARAERELAKVRAVAEEVRDVAARLLALGGVVDPHLAVARRLEERRLERVRRVHAWRRAGAECAKEEVRSARAL